METKNESHRPQHADHAAFPLADRARDQGDIAANDQFRVSKLTTTCHGFSHVDAAAHFVAGPAPTIETTRSIRVVGLC